MGDEPIEILKAAKKQVGIKESASSSESSQGNYENNGQGQTDENLKEQIAESDKKNLEDLQSKMEEIRRQKVFESLLARIQAGEDVPLEEFQELSYEQRDVLKAQLEAYKKRGQTVPNQQALVEPATKRSRRFGGFGRRKNAAEKQQTRVEMPLPPSG